MQVIKKRNLQETYNLPQSDGITNYDGWFDEFIGNHNSLNYVQDVIFDNRNSSVINKAGVHALSLAIDPNPSEQETSFNNVITGEIPNTGVLNLDFNSHRVFVEYWEKYSHLKRYAIYFHIQNVIQGNELYFYTYNNTTPAKQYRTKNNVPVFQGYKFNIYFTYVLENNEDGSSPSAAPYTPEQLFLTNNQNMRPQITLTLISYQATH